MHNSLNFQSIVKRTIITFITIHPNSNPSNVINISFFIAISDSSNTMGALSIFCVAPSDFQDVGALLLFSKSKHTIALPLLGAWSAKDMRKNYLKLPLSLHPDKPKDPCANGRFQLMLRAYHLLKGDTGWLRNITVPTFNVRCLVE